MNWVQFAAPNGPWLSESGSSVPEIPNIIIVFMTVIYHDYQYQRAEDEHRDRERARRQAEDQVAAMELARRQKRRSG